MKYGFDNEKYLKIQSEHIQERIAQFGNKLYLELGGKLFDDHHASRVLPGFQPDSKLRMLSKLSDRAEIVIVISAVDIEKNKVRTDLGITYDMDVLRLRNEFQNRGFLVSSVVITHYNGQSSADAFRKRLERMGINAYYHYLIDGYPTNVELIASDEEQHLGLKMPSNYNSSTVDTLAAAAHQYVVSMAVADWFTITHKTDAPEYSSLAEVSLQIISEAVNKRSRPKRTVSTAGQ